MSIYSADGWSSEWSKLGTNTGDKTIAGVSHGLETISTPIVESLWRGSALAARIIERPAQDMMRQGWYVDTGDPTLDKSIRGFADDIAADPAILLALMYRRAYGGGAVYMDIDDGLDPLQPLNVSLARARLAHGGRGIRSMRAYFAGYEIRALDWDRDPCSPRRGEPITYQLYEPQMPSLTVHYTRLLRFVGPVVSRTHRISKLGWGESVITRVIAALREYDLSWSAIVNAMQEFSHGVFKLEGLATLLSGSQKGAVAERANTMSLTRSILGSTFVDSKDDYKRESIPMGGLDTIMDSMAVRLAAVADIPVTLLMGQSPAGLAATGDSDIRNYYDRIRSEQMAVLKPELEYLVRTILDMRGIDAGDWRICFPPLWQMSEIEKATVLKTKIDGAVAAVNAGIVTQDEAASALFGGDDSAIPLDKESRAEADKILSVKP